MTIHTTAQVGVVAEPELRFTKGGKAWVSIRAVSKPRKNVNGQWVDGDPTWLNVVVFGKGAEMLVESGVTKGSRLLVTGRLENREWEDRDGNKRFNLEITADTVGLDTTFTAYERVAVERSDRGAAARRDTEPAAPQWSDEAPF